MTLLVDKTCKETTYLTPTRLLDPCRRYLGGYIGLDPATESDNPTRAVSYLTETENGLNIPWDTDHGKKYGVFVNPPYGKHIKEWVFKIQQEAAKGLCILAVLPGQRLEQLYWQRSVFNKDLRFVCLVRKRVSFIRSDGFKAKANPFGSMIYAYGLPDKFVGVPTDMMEDAAWFSTCFGELGLCFAPLVFNYIP